MKKENEGLGSGYPSGSTDSMDRNILGLEEIVHGGKQVKSKKESQYPYGLYRCADTG